MPIRSFQLAPHCQIAPQTSGGCTVSDARRTLDIDAEGTPIVHALREPRSLHDLLGHVRAGTPALAVVRTLVRLEHAGLLAHATPRWTWTLPASAGLARLAARVQPRFWQRLGQLLCAASLAWALGWLVRPQALAVPAPMAATEIAQWSLVTAISLLLWRALAQALAAEAGATTRARGLRLQSGPEWAHSAMTTAERQRATAAAWAGLAALAAAHVAAVAVASLTGAPHAHLAAWLATLALLADAMPQGHTDAHALVNLATALPALGHQARAWLVRRAFRNLLARKPVSAAEQRYVFAASLGLGHALLAWLLCTQQLLPWAGQFASRGVRSGPPALAAIPLLLASLFLLGMALALLAIVRDALWAHRPQVQAKPGSSSGAPHAAQVLSAAEKVPFLRSLGPAALAQLPARMTAESWPAGVAILRQGDPGDRMCCLVEGYAVVEWEDDAGVRHPIARLHPGDFFGETAVLEDTPRTAHVVADGPVLVASLPRALARTWLDGLGADPAEMRRQMRHAAALRAHPLFAGMSAADLAHVVAQTEPVSMAAGVDVLRAGDRGEDVYVLLSGTCSVHKGLAQVGTLQVGTLQAGDWFGELALLTGAPRNATVRAESAVELLRLPVSATQLALARDPEAAWRLWQVATERLASALEVAA